jgi:hypothetical protein
VEKGSKRICSGFKGSEKTQQKYEEGAEKRKGSKGKRKGL